MRGKEYFLRYFSFYYRITPAHAGKRLNHVRFAGCPWDHPRACGEKSVAVSTALVESWITPAHAGKRLANQHTLRLSQDHPRACGEKDFSRACKTRQVGSPPRMRGKDVLELNTTAYPRITPAHAGKSIKICRETRRLQDHPRACGEKITISLTMTVATGSPPRMRGKEE